MYISIHSTIISHRLWIYNQIIPVQQLLFLISNSELITLSSYVAESIFYVDSKIFPLSFQLSFPGNKPLFHNFYHMGLPFFHETILLCFNKINDENFRQDRCPQVLPERICYNCLIYIIIVQGKPRFRRIRPGRFQISSHTGVSAFPVFPFA